jgi:hypothetical protein
MAEDLLFGISILSLRLHFMGTVQSGSFPNVLGNAPNISGNVPDTQGNVPHVMGYFPND